MSFAFFYPLAWLGAIAIGVPIWLHLKRREDPDLVRFSALQFLDDQPAARRRWRWPHNWPLLLLRLTGLLAIVAAFSWPFLPSTDETIIQESRVYILDNTLSHQANDRFAEARQETLDQLRQAEPSAQIAVIEITDQPRVIVNFGDTRQAALARLQTLQASHQRGSYLAAFRLADQLLQQSLGETRRIIFLSDSQANQWSEGEKVPPFLEQVVVTSPEVPSGDVSNVAVAEPTACWDLRAGRSIVKSSVQLYHQGPIDNVVLVFQNNGEAVLRKEVSLRQQPETMTLLAEWEANPNDWIQGQIRVELADDALAADNQVYFALPPVTERQVGLLSHSTFLRAAFSPDVMRGRWAAKLLEPRDFPLSPQEASQLEVLCATTEDLESDPARVLVLDFLQDGRGVFLLIDPVNPSMREFLQRLKIEFLPPQQPTVPSNFRYVFMEHPIFQSFQAADFGNLTEVSVNQYRRLKMPQATPLIFSATGDPLLWESQEGAGKLLVLAFSPNRADTDWAVHPTFIPFLDRCLDHVCPENVQTRTQEPGEMFVWTVAPGQQVERVQLTVPNHRGSFSVEEVPVERGQVQHPAVALFRA